MPIVVNFTYEKTVVVDAESLTAADYDAAVKNGGNAFNVD
jgi:hypothetical protein